MRRREFLFSLAATGALAFANEPAAGGVVPFILGVIPIHSVRVLVDRYEPLRAYLERAVGHPVRVETAVDFRHFQRETLAGHYDFVVTPIHFARMAQLDGGWHPLVQLHPPHDAMLLHARARPLTLPDGLRGKQLAVVDTLAISVMATLALLERQALVAGRDYQVREHRSHASAAQSVVSGLSAALVSTTHGLNQVPTAMRRQLVITCHVADVPSLVIMARPDLPAAQLEALRGAILVMPADPLGQALFRNIGYFDSLRAANETAMRRGDPYLTLTRKSLASR